MRRVTTDIDWSEGDRRYWRRAESTNNDVAVHFTLDGEGEPVGPGVWGEAVIPFDGVITGWALLSQTAADATLDVWRCPTSAYPPSVLDTITGDLPPVLVGEMHAESTDVATWATVVQRGDVLRVMLTAAENLYYGTFVLYLARPGVLMAEMPNLDQKADRDHDHDERYYTEAEIDGMLGGFNPAHDHDDRYYTEAEIDALLAGLAAHDHDDRYFTEDEITNLLGGKANLTHTHDASQVVGGTFTTAQIPALDAAKIASGTFAEARIPSLSLAKIPALPASQITSGTFGTAMIPNLDAGKITTGTFGTARIPTLDASKIGTGEFSTARIPDLSASKITSGVLAIGRLPAHNHRFDELQAPTRRIVTSGQLLRVGPGYEHAAIGGTMPVGTTIAVTNWSQSGWYFGIVTGFGVGWYRVEWTDVIP